MTVQARKSGDSPAGITRPLTRSERAPLSPADGGLQRHLPETRLAVAALAVAMAAAAGGLWWLGRGTTFFFDEWNFVTLRSRGGLDTLLQSHNGHLYAVPAVLYRLLFAT